VWRDGEEDSSDAAPLRASRDGNAKAEAESAAHYSWERGEDVTEGWRPDGGRTWRWL
jgi:hypothetical protein